MGLALGVTFPIVMLLMQLYPIIATCFGENWTQNDQLFITKFTGIEAAVESTCQLLLQIFTILYKYPSSTIQKITIATSFIQIARCSILLDVETKMNILGKNLTFKQSLVETLTRLPCYTSTIFFRIFSLALTMAFLRLWSTLPISI